MSGEELVVIGRLGRPRGVKGELYVRAATDYPERFNGMKEIYVATRDGWDVMKIAQCNMIGDSPVIKFENVGSPEEASRLTNRDLAVPKDQLVTLPDGAYFIFDLIGCEVVDDKSGKRIGELVDVGQYPANDVYVVKTSSEKQLMIPAVEKFVKSVDIAAKKITVDVSGLGEE